MVMIGAMAPAAVIGSKIKRGDYLNFKNSTSFAVNF
jgi:hypothetical protein